MDNNLNAIIKEIENKQKDFVVDSIYKKGDSLFVSLIPSKKDFSTNDFVLKYDSKTGETEGCLLFEEFDSADEILKSQIYKR